MNFFDPPSGWRYGFPKGYNPEEWLKFDIEEELRKAGYPEKDIPLAKKWSRYWAYEEGEEV